MVYNMDDFAAIIFRRYYTLMSWLYFFSGGSEYGMADARHANDPYTHFDVEHRDVVSIIAAVPGGVAIRGLMIRSFIEAFLKAHRIKDDKAKHLDIGQVFYDTNQAVVTESAEHKLEQVCEMRSTLTKKLSLTQIFRPPANTESA